MKKRDKKFFVKTISKNVNLNEFDRDFVVDLDAAIRLSEKKGKISVQDLLLFQLSN
jgi:tRNA G26 N,N-dimethylase Trm1